MKRVTAGAVLLALLVIVGVGTAFAQPSSDLRLTVMTYNLRYAGDSPPNAWATRRPMMKRLIEAQDPDIIGTQEGFYRQLKDLTADLPAYDWIGLGRDGGSRGEFMAIFFKRIRFEPLAYDHFWLSDTPDVIGSTSWGNTNRRMVTWVRFREHTTGREFSVWNTHLDHAIELARQKGAELIRSRLASADASLPLLLTGDFDSPAGTSRAYEILTKEAGLDDAWMKAAVRRNDDVATFNDFKGPVQGGPRIDWVLVRGRAEVTSAETVTYEEHGAFPSDHFPVTVRLVFPPAAPDAKCFDSRFRQRMPEGFVAKPARSALSPERTIRCGN